MTVEVIWKYVNCPLLGGVPCEKEECVALIYGKPEMELFYDKEWTETRKSNSKIYYSEYKGWIFKRRVPKVDKEEYTYDVKFRHYCKELTMTPIICIHHEGQTLGKKFSITNMDEEHYETSNRFNTLYFPPHLQYHVSFLEERVEEHKKRFYENQVKGGRNNES